MSSRVPVLALLVVLVVTPVAAATGHVPPMAGTATRETARATQPTEQQVALPVIGDSNRTTNRLVLPAGSVRTTTVGNASLDVAGAIGAGADATAGKFATLQLEERFRAAGTPAARRTVLERSQRLISERIATLRDRERAALDAYNAGELTTATYLARLARIHAAAVRLETTVGRLSEYASSVRDSPVTDHDIARLRARLLPLQSPVRARTIRALTGQIDAMRVYVSTSETGVVTAAVTGPTNGRYIRSAYLSSARKPDQIDQFKQHEDHPFTIARDRAEQLYPWAFANRLSLSIGDPVLYRVGVYPVVIDHPQGTSRTGDLVTYLDGGTTDAFLEHQYKTVAKMPTTPLGTNETATLRLVVNRTHAGGPLSIRVTTPNGSAVDATVSVNGVRVGTTGIDGQYWTIAPDGTITVTATARGETVTVTGQS